MLTLSHPASNSLTFLSYDHEAGMVEVNVTHPSDVDPERSRMPLAIFLREIGIPFKAVRAITSGERLQPSEVA